MKTAPGRDRLVSSRPRGTSLAPLRCLEITEDPPGKALQEVGLAAAPRDPNPEKTTLCESAREKYQMCCDEQGRSWARASRPGRRRPALALKILPTIGINFRFASRGSTASRT